MDKCVELKIGICSLENHGENKDDLGGGSGFADVLIYIVTVLSVLSSFHYSFTTARHPGGSTPEEK